MGNLITNNKANLDLQLSNGATSVLISVLILAGSDLAQSRWEQELVTWMAEHDQSIFGLGIVGFDINEIAWSPEEFEQQKSFLLNMITKAHQRYRWEQLDYDPPYAEEQLLALQHLVELFTVEMIVPNQLWNWYQEPEKFEKCSLHNVYRHANGCPICHDR